MSDESALHRRTEPRPLLAAYLRARYALKRALADLSPADRDEYHLLLDVYNVTRNGDARFVAIAAVLNGEVQGAKTLLDLGCYEGYAIAHLMRHTTLGSFAGVEVSPRLITRAQDTCRGLTGSFHLFDLEQLYADPQLRSESWMTPYDVVLAAELLYYLGPRSYWAWTRSAVDRERKRAFVDGLRGFARRAVVFQHFGKRETHAIGEIVVSCGGRLVDSDWGIYLLRP